MKNEKKAKNVIRTTHNIRFQKGVYVQNIDNKQFLIILESIHGSDLNKIPAPCV